MGDTPPSEPPSFEHALQRLDAIVDEMEHAQLPLHDILTRYEEGMRLRAFCEEQLRLAELRVAQIRPARDGTPEIKPLPPAPAPAQEALHESVPPPDAAAPKPRSLRDRGPDLDSEDFLL